MAQRISRRLMTEHVAERLLQGDREVIARLAAYLVETRRTKELDTYVYDVEMALLAKGVVVADVVSARDLSKATQDAVTTFLRDAYGAKQIELRREIDPSLIGGVRVKTADAEYDASLQRRLNKLQKMKV